jgi:hypothetical protein
MRSLSRGFCLVLVGLLACGGEAPPALKVEPKPAPKVEPPAPVDPGLPLHERGRVFLVGGEVGYVPLACSDRGAAPPRRFAGGEACLGLLPAGSAVRGVDGEVRKVKGKAEDPCEGGPAVTIEGAPESWRGHATAPPVDGEWVEVVPPTTPAEADAAASAELKAKLAAAIEKDHAGVKAVKKLQVRQRAIVDVDGDGAPEQVIAVVVPGPRSADGEETLAFAGLYVVSTHEAPARKLAGAAPGALQYTVLGALDLDRDGKPELWLNTYDADRFTQSVEQVGEAGLTQLGKWVCGA